MQITTIIKDNGYAAFPSVSRMRDGRIAVLYHRGANHVSADAKMYCKIGDPTGRIWGPEVLVASHPTWAVQGGCIKALRDGTLLAFTWCLNVVSPTEFQSVGLGECRRSLDGGRTWSAPSTIGGCSGYTSMECGAIELADETILLPVFGQDPAVVRCKVMQSVDKGATWTVRGVIDQTQSLVEVCLLEVNPGGTATGVLVASLRNQGTGKIAFSRSADGGKNWSTAVDLFPGASTAPMIQTPSGALLTCYRSMSTLNYSQMAFRTSLDAGLSWSDESVLLNSIQNGFEYAGLVRMDGGQIGLAFSQQTSTTDAWVKFLVADEEEFGIQPTANVQGLNVIDGDVRVRNGNLWLNNTNGIHYFGCLTNGSMPGEIRVGGASPGWCGQMVLYGRLHGSDPGSIALNPTEGGKIRLNGPVLAPSLPTSATGLTTGQLYRVGEDVKVKL